MNTLDIYSSISEQISSLRSAGYSPTVAKMSETTASLLTEHLKASVTTGPQRIMGISMSIDNSLRFGIVRVMGAYQ